LHNAQRRSGYSGAVASGRLYAEGARVERVVIAERARQVDGDTAEAAACARVSAAESGGPQGHSPALTTAHGTVRARRALLRVRIGLAVAPSTVLTDALRVSLRREPSRSTRHAAASARRMSNNVGRMRWALPIALAHANRRTCNTHTRTHTHAHGECGRHGTGPLGHHPKDNMEYVHDSAAATVRRGGQCDSAAKSTPRASSTD
jgi:hypothetical protein